MFRLKRQIRKSLVSLVWRECSLSGRILMAMGFDIKCLCRLLHTSSEVVTHTQHTARWNATPSVSQHLLQADRQAWAPCNPNPCYFLPSDPESSHLCCGTPAEPREVLATHTEAHQVGLSPDFLGLWTFTRLLSLDTGEA